MGRNRSKNKGGTNINPQDRSVIVKGYYLALKWVSTIFKVLSDWSIINMRDINHIYKTVIYC